MPITALRMVPPATAAFAFLIVLGLASGDTSNYDKQAISITYEGEGLPTQGLLNGTVTELDTLSPRIVLNKTDAALNCSSGFMHIDLTFREPFFGIVYADYDRNSACKISGNGKFQEAIKLPLKGCGTLQRPARVFTNNIVVRFHPGLEIDGDEVITVVCRYPPPIVPLPALALPVQLPVDAPVRTLQPLRELEILMIICAIIFLALLLLGVGCSYYCLKKRNIKVVRRRPQSSLMSDVTARSQPISMFDGLKLPRVAPQPASGSEEMTESVKTDFPSDIASIESDEEYTSAYSDKMCVLPEGAIVSRLHDPPNPGFDVSMLVRDRALAYTPDLTAESSESETVLNAQEQYLTTILERTETNTLETLERIRAAKAQPGPPPVHARINIKNKTTMSDASDLDSMSEYSHGTEMFSEQEMELDSRHVSNFALESSSLNQGFDVMIKQRAGQHRLDDYTSMSESEASTTHDVIRPVIHHRGDSSSYLDESSASRMQQHHESYSTSKHVHVRDQNMSNFDVLIRIVDQPTGFASTIGAESTARDEVSSVFTEDEKMAIKEVILQDVSIQEELKSTYVRQNFLVLKNNEVIRETVQPQKWDVLIRILDIPDLDPNEDRQSSHTGTSQALSAGDYHQRMSFSGVSSGAAGGGQHMSHSQTAAAVHQSSSQFTDSSVRYVDGGVRNVDGGLRYVDGGVRDVAGGVRYADVGGIDARSVATSHGAHSAADRSAAEITEFHHYTTKSETMTSAQQTHEASSSAHQQFGWYEEESQQK